MGGGRVRGRGGGEGGEAELTPHRGCVYMSKHIRLRDPLGTTTTTLSIDSDVSHEVTTELEMVMLVDMVVMVMFSSFVRYSKYEAHCTGRWLLPIALNKFPNTLPTVLPLLPPLTHTPVAA